MVGKGGIFNPWQITEKVKILQVPVRRPSDPLAGKPHRLSTMFYLSSLYYRDSDQGWAQCDLSICLEEPEQSFMPNMAEKKKLL